MAKAISSPLLICGDFNAPHTQWGYGADLPKGKRLAKLMDGLGLVLLNEPASHTRIGQGACHDTSPDPYIWSDAGAITWSNTFEDLVSDHRVLCVTMGEDEAKMGGCQKARVVDWDKFRKHREREKQEGPNEDIGELCRELLADVGKATKEIEWLDRRKEPEGGDRLCGSIDDSVLEPSRVDSRLAHLVAAKKSMQ
ncbi:hypothetical protein HPB51_012920 [Rhipicephalus microplus]|uniref:Endonuclease/exonuclease/phosphatase domain-containing protein n=1 Tax=Rhipicephalus microplus TaxID=6941 RepID=A0A9J6F1P3_RHIMP|nr:hypothetical protein HPB51_012920 [Rhipicephalus microplus]